jgi:hypothetical protein
MYATNHQGNIASADDPAAYDANSVGVRAEYGVMKDLDVLGAYSFDTLPNLKTRKDQTQLSGNTMDLGVKYTVIKDGAMVQGMNIPMDVAVGFGYELSNVSVKGTGFSGAGISSSTIALAGIVSKKFDTIVAYGGIGYKMLSQTYDKKLTGGVDVGAIPGVGLAFNIGCAIGIAADQAILVEYNTENQKWSEAKKGGATIIDENAINVSGISLGYAYTF